MASLTGSTRSIENIEHLSDVIIETLKSMSNNRQPLSSAFLSQALARRPEVIELLVRREDQSLVQSLDKAGEEARVVRSLKSQVHEEQASKEQTLRQIALLQAQNVRLRDFCKRSLITMMALAQVAEGSGLAQAMDQLKRLLMADTVLEQLEDALNDLKDIILQESCEDKKPSCEGETGNLFSRWLKRKDTKDHKASGQQMEEYLKSLQGIFLDILTEFHLDLGEEYLGAFSGVQKRIRESEGLEELVQLSGEILAVISHYLRLLGEERSQMTEFIAEVGINLMEVENHFQASMERTSQAHDSNNTFNNIVESQMDDIRGSAQISKTLAEFKSLVVARIATIKEALESKRKDDESRLQEANREMEELQQNLKAVKKEIEQVQERSKVLEQETLIDPLTGTHNRRAYSRKMKEELQRYRRMHHPFSLLIFDVDHFKKVNDQYGHWAGDKCLKEIIKRIRPVLRETDFLARYGGEEFVVLLPGIEQDNALIVAEKLCKLIEKTRFVYKGKEIPLTISIGVTQVKPADQSGETIFTRADQAVYQAKQSGRNRAMVA